jgi:glycosyltransferase involved in cell wall biosynthesis
VIIGDGPLRRRLQSLVDALNLQRNVQFQGALSHAQVMRWIRRAAMVVVPSVKTSTGRVEGLGMVHLEAAATGVPAIGSRSGGIPEGIVDGETGYLVPERQTHTLADRIGYLLDHPRERHRLGTNARRFVEERFHLSRQTEKLEALYDRLLSGKNETQAIS